MIPDPSRRPQPPPGQHTPGESAVPTLLDQAFDRDSLYALRAAVAAHGAQAGLPQRRVEDLVIAAHELAANAIRHGAGRGRLRLWTQDGMLHCEVTDSGPRAEREPRQAVLSGEPGHGLWLVRQVADQAIVRSGPDGTSAVITFTVVSPADHGR
jgi:anti-sigma regulatory factor (Ser/Thr protein kinase)